MNHFKDFSIKLKSILSEENLKIDEPMKKHTSFRVGGPADIMVTPENYEQLRDIIRICNENDVPFFVLGNGTNLLVKDGGIRGVVIRLNKLNKVLVEEGKIIAQAGASLVGLSFTAFKQGLAGLEFACGIPGSIGGAVAMNAGAYNGEVGDFIESALVINRQGKIQTLTKKEMKFEYRTSEILKNKYIVLEVTFNLKSGNSDDIKSRMDLLSQKRKQNQPLEYPSAGSTFKRPEGHFAAKLIDDCGLKGVHVGDAEVSSKHSGFIINKGNAYAKDILELIKNVKEKVNEKYNVCLQPEVRIIGEDK